MRFALIVVVNYILRVILVVKPNGLENVRIKDYECSVCHKRVSASFDEFIENSSNYTRAVKHWGVKLSEIGEESYEKKS